MTFLRSIPLWFWVTLFVTWFAHQLAGASTQAMVSLMSGVTEFAREVRTQNMPFLHVWRFLAYTSVFAILIRFLWPIVDWFRRGGRDAGEPSSTVRERVVSAPLAIAAVGFAGWLASIPFVIGVTIFTYGFWSTELVSQHVLAPLVNGFLASVLAYLLTDWTFRAMVVPDVFPEGGLAEVPGTFRLGVRGRLFALVAAVGFVPLFTMLGLIRAAAVRQESGASAEELLANLTEAGQVTFAVYVILGVVLTWVVARFLTRPLTASAAVLSRVRRGDLDVHVRGESADEVGILADGVSDLARALRERQDILTTFGRVVEPEVRDQLLGGRDGGAGEQKLVTVMFIDLRGFTALSESRAPSDVVDTLNEFFTVVTAWVRECGGFVDKFIGDALLVVFGLFERDEARVLDGGASTALACARGLGERLDELNRARALRGEPALAVSVGIHTGDVVAGTIGWADRHEYTVIGDTVNIAARLQVLCKESADGILVSEQTFAAARAAGTVVADELPVRTVSLRGRAQTVGVYEVPFERSPNSLCA